MIKKFYGIIFLFTFLSSVAQEHKDSHDVTSEDPRTFVYKVRAFFTDPQLKFFGQPPKDIVWPSDLLRDSQYSFTSSPSAQTWLERIAPVLESISSKSELKDPEKLVFPFGMKSCRSILLGNGLSATIRKTLAASRVLSPELIIINGSVTADGKKKADAHERFVPLAPLRGWGCGFHAAVNALIMHAIFTKDYSMAAQIKDFVLNSVMVNPLLYPPEICTRGGEAQFLALKKCLGDPLTDVEVDFLNNFENADNVEYPVKTMSLDNIRRLLNSILKEGRCCTLCYTVNRDLPDSLQEKPSLLIELVKFLKQEFDTELVKFLKQQLNKQAKEQYCDKSITVRFALIGSRVHGRGTGNPDNFHYSSIVFCREFIPGPSVVNRLYMVFLDNATRRTDKDFEFAQNVADELVKALSYKG